MKPTKLYIKRHKLTGLLYFGKTTRKDVAKYNGSGKHWSRHIKKHGKEHVEHIWESEVFSCKEELVDFALSFSELFDIVESDKWANIREENGLDGKPPGSITPEDTKQQISRSLTGKPSPKSKYVIHEDRDLRKARIASYVEGTIWVNNGIISKRVAVIEDGWVEGRLGNIGDKSIGSRNISGNNTRGKKIYNNGVKHAFFIENAQPEGWIRGKIPGTK